MGDPQNPRSLVSAVSNREANVIASVFVMKQRERSNEGGASLIAVGVCTSGPLLTARIGRWETHVVPALEAVNRDTSGIVSVHVVMMKQRDVNWWVCFSGGGYVVLAGVRDCPLLWVYCTPAWLYCKGDPERGRTYCMLLLLLLPLRPVDSSTPWEKPNPMISLILSCAQVAPAADLDPISLLL